MTINIQNASTVNVNGIHNGRNSKVVYCITTGEFFASVLDTAAANGVSASAISLVLCGKTKTCNGKRFCYLSKIMEHLEEINEQNRINAKKIAAYDAIVAEQKAKREREEAEKRRKAEAQERLAKQQEKCNELRKKLDEEMKRLYEAEEECK